jgi:hypothetical protein
MRWQLLRVLWARTEVWCDTVVLESVIDCSFTTNSLWVLPCKKLKSSLSNQLITGTCGDTYLLSTSAIRTTAAPIYGKHDTFQTGCGTFPTSFCRWGDGRETNTATKLGHGLVLELCGRRMCRSGVQRDFIWNVEVCGALSSTKQNRVARNAWSQNVVAVGQWNRNIRQIQRHRITDIRRVFRAYREHWGLWRE